MRIVRMRAERAINLDKAFRDCQHLRVPAHARRDRNHALDSSGAGACHHGIELADKVGKIEMTVTVDQCQSWRQAAVFCGIGGHIVGLVASGYSIGTYPASFSKHVSPPLPPPRRWV